MKHAAKLFVLFCFTAITLSGCKNNDASLSTGYRVVTQVDIACRHEETLVTRHYTEAKKMESVLLYLRLLKPLGKPESDPELLDREVFEITVSLSDGTRKHYRQKAHRYITRENRPWEVIDPAQAYGLYALMRHYPSDTNI